MSGDMPSRGEPYPSGSPGANHRGARLRRSIRPAPRIRSVWTTLARASGGPAVAGRGRKPSPRPERGQRPAPPYRPTWPVSAPCRIDRLSDRGAQSSAASVAYPTGACLTNQVTAGEWIHGQGRFRVPMYLEPRRRVTTRLDLQRLSTVFRPAAMFGVNDVHRPSPTLRHAQKHHLRTDAPTIGVTRRHPAPSHLSARPGAMRGPVMCAANRLSSGVGPTAPPRGHLSGGRRAPSRGPRLPVLKPVPSHRPARGRDPRDSRLRAEPSGGRAGGVEHTSAFTPSTALGHPELVEGSALQGPS